MVHDRGSIKWTSLMLPEHVELLKSIWNEDKKIKKPVLDEQEIEVLNMLLIEAYEEKQPITITYYKNHQLLSIKGQIIKLDSIHNSVFVKSPDQTFTIPFSSIYQIT
ncbi:YolD-like family protein [Ornithinibacillus scapharcae]|uniref:YolD-like family protein n=1 Tax=Ornithinibacillus scapharcae TaxID=1147159 RepID=UPI000225B302|nr:YolD-like family protein [Ornithinibacillus scapharcae]